MTHMKGKKITPDYPSKHRLFKRKKENSCAKTKYMYRKVKPFNLILINNTNYMYSGAADFVVEYMSICNT